MAEHSTIQVIRNADWAVLWDGAAQAHRYARDVDIAYDAGGILYAGPRYDGPFGAEVSGVKRMVMPGLIDIHCHSGDEPLVRGVFDDAGTAALYGNALYEYSGVMDFDADPDALAASLTVLISELMKSGVTTIMDLTRPHANWMPIMAQSGARGYIAAGFREASWHVHNSHRLDFEWDAGRGREGFAHAVEAVEAARAHPSGRLSGALAPSQIETCSEGLLTDASAKARAMGVPITIHAAQTMAEHDELIRRHGLTATQYMARLGILGPELVIGHCIFLDHHSWTRQRTNDDLATLAESGASVAHCPVAFSRSGMTLETVGRYQRAGVNLGIGTDTYPHNYIEEMRTAMICARIGAKSVFDVDTGAIFNAATIGGARALGRDDIGRIAPGAKADLVLIDLDHPGMKPVYDPLRSLLHGAADRAVRDVIIDGAYTVRDFEVVTLDYRAAAEALNAGLARALPHVAKRDPKGRDIATLGPLTYPS